MLPVEATGKRVEHGLRPRPTGGQQFEDYAVAVGPAARPAQERRAVQVTACVESKTGDGLPTVCAAGEVIDDALGPAPSAGRQQLEHGPKPVSSTADCRSIKVAGAIQDQPCLRVVRIRRSLKAGENLLSCGPSRAR